MDTDALHSHLSAALGETVTGLEVLADGLNLVVAVQTAEADPAYVLRRPNKLRDSDLFVDLRTEYEVLRRLEPTPVPAPEPVLFCESVEGLDGSAVVTTHLAGAPFPWAAELSERYRNADSRDRIATRVVETLAEVHGVDTEPFAEVCERQSALEQAERTAVRLDAVADETGHELTRLRQLGDRLRGRAPDDTETTLVHGDFRAGNLLFSGPRPEVTGVLDWETAMLGDPLTELGCLLLDWRGGTEPWPSPDELDVPADAAGMDRVREIHAEGLTPFTTRDGSPSAAELVGRYESLTGRTFEHGTFYRALAAFGLATVWADLHRHAVANGEVEPADTLPVVEYLGLVGERILDGN
jgi:aminoglycoside phosphotransferase (APT) family kinase protein